MFSVRTLPSECVNLANPLGFHLSDGTVYQHIDGTEYEDIAAAWNWNLIPGITTDYGNTPLECETVGTSSTETWVGGVSNGARGLAVMSYTNPITHAMSWQKTWFFLDNDVQYVMLNGVTSTSDAPVFSVLDQRRLSPDGVQRPRGGD